MTVSIKTHFSHAPSQESIEFKRVMDATLADMTVLRDEVVLVGTTLANYKTEFDAHTHTQTNGDGVNTSIPDDTAGGIATAGNDVVFTDSSTAVAALTLIS